MIGRWCRRALTFQSPDFTGGDGIKEVGRVHMPIPQRAADALYAVVSPECVQKLDLPGIDGSGWWASRNWRKKLTKFDAKTGELWWAVGRRASAVAEPGQMYHPMSVSGISGDLIFVPDTLGPLWVWHRDGLFLGHLFKDHQAGEQDLPIDQESYGEIQSTFVFTHPQTGQAYHIGCGNETRVHALIPPVVQRLASQPIILTPEQARSAKPWDPDGLAPTEKPTYTVAPAPGDAIAGSYKVKVNGALDGREGWGRPQLVLLDGQRLAEFRAMYDAENLYLAYTVSHPAGPANSGSELPYAPFVSGAYVDFSIAPDWSKPQRREVREGDVRVIVAQVRNGAAAESQFTQGFWQKKAGGTNPQTIASPAAKVHFDHIGAVPGLQVAYKVKPKDEKTGNIQYTVEIAVPLASLGLRDVAGKSIGFDASVGIANPAGDQRSAPPTGPA